MPPREEHQNLEENYQPARTPSFSATSWSPRFRCSWISTAKRSERGNESRQDCCETCGRWIIGSESR
ncbi:Cytosolic protein [Caenorhabditis elegans]|uniref:Cytosolic protein n=1 Tax=Caenorhabditis elegans TaxID=6239 RepID=Q9TYJ4_CAEEL|nr:Cytosolic protein [Caenorhabditis elegans]CCD69502.2 Cytosolic protein [Caenorhabditis elegans]